MRPAAKPVVSCETIADLIVRCTENDDGYVFLCSDMIVLTRGSSFALLVIRKKSVTRKGSSLSLFLLLSLCLSMCVFRSLSLSLSASLLCSRVIIMTSGRAPLTRLIGARHCPVLPNCTHSTGGAGVGQCCLLCLEKKLKVSRGASD